jgi:hypothetical protein
MKKLLFILLLLPSLAYAEFVSPYVKKDGTFVNGYYRNPKGFGKTSYSLPTLYYPQQVATNSKPVPQTSSNNIKSNLNLTFYNYYKKAAMLKGDSSNLAKLKYISQFKETEILWQTFIDSHSYCHDEACFVNWIGSYSGWSDVNQKINNIYNTLTSGL